MAAGPWIVYGPAKHALVDGNLDIDTHSYRMVLITASYTPNANAHDTWSDVSANEVANGNGYTTHGKALTMTSIDGGSGTTTVDCNDQSWTASTITAKYAGIVRDGNADGALAAGDLLLAYCDLDIGGGSVSTNNGTFAVNINGSGLFTLN